MMALHNEQYGDRMTSKYVIVTKAQKREAKRQRVRKLRRTPIDEPVSKKYEGHYA